MKQKALVALAAAAVTSVLFLNYCDLIYQCGCEGVWGALDRHCNIHSTGRHCPVCMLSFGGQVGVWAMMVVPQVVVSYWRAAWNWRVRVALAITVFPVAGLLPTIGLGMWTGYWNK
ncbi:MAG: hypothetical protein HY820_15810 [Acidobacteria bacterium]|nr:hypothetical protein [Acidobacteriota bacterium]